MKMENKEQLLSAYKKANKERRRRIVEKAGFLNEEAYLFYLTTTEKKAKESKKKVTIHNVHILDKSGSMYGNKFDNALESINEETQDLQKESKVNYTQTMVAFSSNNDIQVIDFMKPISEVKKYNARANGGTALLDAIANTLLSVEKAMKKGDKVLVKIFTDGGENDSRKYSWIQVNDIIVRLQKVGFTITFVGTALDVEIVKKNLSIDDSNTLVHDNTAAGIKKVGQLRRAATATYSAATADGLDTTFGFYNKKVGTL